MTLGTRSLQLIRESDILDESYRVAIDFRGRALTALEVLPESETKTTLVELAHFVTQRRS